jgi:hypothetical protein
LAAVRRFLGSSASNTLSDILVTEEKENLTRAKRDTYALSSFPDTETSFCTFPRGGSLSTERVLKATLANSSLGKGMMMVLVKTRKDSVMSRHLNCFINLQTGVRRRILRHVRFQIYLKQNGEENSAKLEHWKVKFSLKFSVRIVCSY